MVNVNIDSTSKPAYGAFADAIRRGDVRAAAQLISLIEDDTPGGEHVLELLSPYTGSAHRIGVTGPPGVGKSTLVGGLTALWRREAVVALMRMPTELTGARPRPQPQPQHQNQDQPQLPQQPQQPRAQLGQFTPESGQLVGVVAVDPTSPFTGGAILGDRVRMGRGDKSRSDPGLFIRSMASRGAFGGLSPAAGDAMDVMDAMGCNPVIVETVGVGQSEVEVASATDTTVLVLSPESGDGVQAMKAGVMEAADIFVVNKADREGARSMARMIEEVLAPVRVAAAHAHRHHPVWRPSVHLCVARDDGGLQELKEAIWNHHQFLIAQGGRELALRRRKATARRLQSLLEKDLMSQFWSDELNIAFSLALNQLSERTMTMRKAASALLQMGKQQLTQKNK